MTKQDVLNLGVEELLKLLPSLLTSDSALHLQEVAAEIGVFDLESTQDVLDNLENNQEFRSLDPELTSEEMDILLEAIRVNIEDRNYFSKPSDSIERLSNYIYDRLFNSFLSDRYENELEGWQGKYYNFEFPLTLYRCVELPSSEEDIEEEFFNSGVGIYWSDDADHAECYWGGRHARSSSTKYTLVAKVLETDIDWEGTLEVNMDFDLGEEEQEVRLIEGRDILLDSITNEETGEVIPVGFKVKS